VSECAQYVVPVAHISPRTQINIDDALRTTDDNARVVSITSNHNLAQRQLFSVHCHIARLSTTMVIVHFFVDVATNHYSQVFGAPEDVRRGRGTDEDVRLHCLVHHGRLLVSARRQHAHPAAAPSLVSLRRARVPPAVQQTRVLDADSARSPVEAMQTHHTTHWSCM
jgi:hypothetical protein